MDMIKKIKSDQYKVESSSKKGKFYTVDIMKPFCNCPQFMFRLVKTGGKCKHIINVEEHFRKKTKTKKDGKSFDKEIIINFIRKNKDVDSIILINKFGEEAVDSLIRNAEVIEFKGKIKVLE